MKNCVVLGGSSNPELAARICHTLDIDPLMVDTSIFSNGETRVNITASVREKHVYIIQSASLHANDTLMELLIMISACKTASAKTVTLVLPLFPYSRQAHVKDALRAHSMSDKQPQTAAKLNGGNSKEFSLEVPGSRLGVSALTTPFSSPQKQPASGRPTLTRQLSNMSPRKSSKGSDGPCDGDTEYNNGYKYWVAQSGPLIATLLSQAGTDHIITLDLHDPQFQGFFDIPVDNLYAQPLLEQYIVTHVPQWQEAVIVSPDAGGAKRATSIADRLGLPFALMHKDGRNNATVLVGNVEDKVAIIIDDLVDTARTLVRAARVIRDHGAKTIYAMVTHGVFSGNSAQALLKSPIDQIVTTNSVATNVKDILGARFVELDVALMFGEAIRRVHNGESISVLFDHALAVM